MNFLSRLEKYLGRFAISNLALYLVAGQLVLFVMALLGLFPVAERLSFIPALVLEGEIWRVFSFVLMPFFVPNPETGISLLNAVFIAFGWYIFWIMSSALEEVWGTFRFNLYLLIGLLATVAGGFLAYALSPALQVIPNQFLYLSVFLAFAYLNPNFELLLMFVLPVKIKWLALIAWVFILLPVIAGPTAADRISAIASVCNFLIFFGPEMVTRIKNIQRRREFERATAVQEDSAFHRCDACGRTDKTDPDKDFRYVTKDGESQCYCAEYLKTGIECAPTDSKTPPKPRV